MGLFADVQFLEKGDGLRAEFRLVECRVERQDADLIFDQGGIGVDQAEDQFVVCGDPVLDAACVVFVCQHPAEVILQALCQLGHSAQLVFRADFRFEDVEDPAVVRIEELFRF